MERCASPDLDAYWSVLSRDFPELDVQQVSWLAAYGNVLRLVDEVSWHLSMIVGASYGALLKPLRALENYEPQLAAALRAVDWSEDD